MLALPVILWQVWAFFAAGVRRAHTQRDAARVRRRSRALLAVGGVALRLLRRAAGGARTSSRTTTTTHYNILIRAKRLLSASRRRCSSRWRSCSSCRCSSSGSTRLGILTTAKLRRTGASATSSSPASRVALPGVDPVTTILETVPLSSCTSSRSGLAVLLDRRAARAAQTAPQSRRDASRLRRLGAPGRRPADRGRRRRLGGRRDRRGRPGRAERHFDDAVILPGIVNAHSHLEYAVYAGFGDGQPFGPGSRTHIARKGRLDADEMVAIARRGAAESLALRDHDDGRLQLLRRRRDRRAPSSGCARSSTSRSSRATRRTRERQFDAKRGARRGDGARADRHLAARARTPARSTSTAGASRSAIPVGTHLAESANENEWLEHGSGPLAGDRAVLVPPTGTARRRDARAGARARAALRALRRGRRRRDRAARRARRPRRALPALERAARLRHRAARRAARRRRRASGSAPTRPASTPSFDVWEELRAAVYAAPRARAAPGRAAGRPTRCGSRRSMRPARSASTTRSVA